MRKIACYRYFMYIITGSFLKRKLSDLDVMIDIGLEVGFDGADSNIFATVDTDKSPPGFLRIRKIGTGQLCSLPENGLAGDSGPTAKEMIIEKWYPQMTHNYQHGPATALSFPVSIMEQVDVVPYFSCSSWPPIAESWITRKRHSYWPSKETIQDIVSKGCRIVHKPHELSKEKETEFRFSFSEAERILFGSLTRDQRKCFIAFKALIKYGIYKIEYRTREDINVSTYCLKTIFLWTCETIPVEHWHNTNGWSKCLLYMIDQLYACLEMGKLPGYFIPESNLLDIMKQSRPLLDEIENMRCNPINICCHIC